MPYYVFCVYVFGLSHNTYVVDSSSDKYDFYSEKNFFSENKTKLKYVYVEL